MSLYIFNSKIYKHFKLFLFFLFGFILINLFIYIVPDDYSKDIYKDAVSYKVDKPKLNHFVKNVKVVAFGDSRSTQAHYNYFSAPTLSFAAPNNTIIFSKFIFNELKTNPSFKPKAVVLYLGPNNFNKNGIFTQRDYAIRRLASFNELFKMSIVEDGLEYALDGFISKLIPLYARRIEIRHPFNLWKLITKKVNAKIPGMYAQGILKSYRVERNLNDDINYTLIYKRSVYNKYNSSKLHLNYLEKLIEEIIEIGAKPILIQLPIERSIQILKDNLVGNKFENYLKKIQKKYDFIYLNETKNLSYQFLDPNHLTSYGHQEFIKEKINPILNNIN